MALAHRGAVPNVTFVVAGVLMAWVVACHGRPDVRGGGPMTEEQLAACAAKIGLAFPPGTRGLGLRETSGLDDSITLKVEIPSDQWTRFVEHSPFQSEEFTEDRRYLLGPDEDWWDPGTPTALPTAQVYGAPGRVLNMGADRSDPKKVIAYLFWHET